jgi:hypothetical protein
MQLLKRQKRTRTPVIAVDPVLPEDMGEESKVHEQSEGLTPTDSPTVEDDAVERVMEQEISEMVSERKREQLESYDYLHRRLYADPETGILYEVQTIVMRKVQKQKVLWAYSTKVESHSSRGESVETDQIQKRLVTGKGGVEELVLKFGSAGGLSQESVLALTANQWLELQRLDDSLASILERIQSDGQGIPCGPGYYLIRQKGVDGALGPLCRLSYNHSHVSHSGVEIVARRRVIQIVVPAGQQRELVEGFHHQLGHPGSRRTMVTMKMKYWFPTIKREVTRCVVVCTHCNERKADNRRAKVPVQNYESVPIPMWRMHADLTGPFPVTPRGVQYILVLKCAFTRFVKTYALVGKNAEYVLKAIDDFMGNFGPVAMLVTDKGTEFCNMLINELSKQLGVRKVNTTAVNPRADGVAENQMRYLKDTLSGYCNRFQDDWDLYLVHIANAYNSTINLATGYTPFYLLFGREMIMPGEESRMMSKEETRTYSKWARKMTEVFLYTWEHVHTSALLNEDRVVTRPVVPLEFHCYELGDWVYLRRVPMRGYKGPKDLERRQTSSKLQMRWTGPYRVVEVHSDVLVSCLVHGKVQVTHAINMKRAAAKREDYAGMRFNANVAFDK